MTKADIKHLLIQVDGNRRWAKRENISLSQAYKLGFHRIIEIVKVCHEIGIKYLTMQIFSVETLKRPQEQVDLMFSLLKDLFENPFDYMTDEEIRFILRSVRINAVGDLEYFPNWFGCALQKIIRLTRQNDDLIFTPFFSTGKAELISCIKKIIQDGLNINQINASEIEKRLYTAGLPIPRLYIRTGTDLRFIDDFLLWKIPFTNLHFSRTLWPDFGKKQLMRILTEYIKMTETKDMPRFDMVI